MTLVFTDEQEELRRTVRSFLDQRSPETEVRRLMETEEGYDDAVWRQMAQQLGLQGLAIPEEFGGSGYTFVELGVVLEEMGRRLLCAPFFSTVVLAGGALVHSGDDAAKKEWLPGIATGDVIATLALTEEDGRWDEDGITTRAVAAGDGWALTGTKSFVLDGGVADLLLIAARTETGVSLFAVPGDADGVTRVPLTTLDLTRKQARVELVGAPATLVGDDGGAWPVLRRVLELAATATAVEQVGGAQRVLEMATEYAKDSVQFGRPIGSFQAIKHKCANMLMAVEIAKSGAYHALRCAAELNEELPEAAAIAKSYCSEAYVQVAADNVQVHGGIGYTYEHPAHLYFRRAKSMALLFGDPAYWREVLARQVGM